MIRKKPVLGLDPRMEAGFPKKHAPAKAGDHASIKMLERQSIQYETIAL
jgi:hypothetical protein